jgi:predicted RNase H-like nuclease (RuvC/YqgF family)
MSDEEVQAALKVLSEAGRKFVPESDLIAAKKGLEGQISDIQTQLATARTDLDAKHQALLGETAAREKAEASVAESSRLGEKVKELEQKLREATTGRDQLLQQMVGLKRLQVAEMSKAIGTEIPAAELEKKTEQQLDSLIEALKLVKPGAKPGFDGGAGGGGGEGITGGRALIKAGLKDHNR